jgi:hypothetical protein
MLGSTLYINSQTSFILCIGLSLLIHQLYKCTIFIAQYFPQIICEMGNLTTPTPKSNMQMCSECIECSVGVTFWDFFGLFSKKTHTAISISHHYDQKRRAYEGS